MPKYIVKKGDTLSTIAKNNNIKLKDILSINDIENPDYIQAGWKINLPDQKTSSNNVPVKSKITPKPVSPVYPKTNTSIQQKPLVTNYNNFFEQYKTKPDVSVKNKPVTTPSSKQKTTDYSQFFEQYKTNNPIQSKTVTSPIKSANKSIEKKEETTGFFDNMEDNVSNLYKKIKTNVNELYQDGLTAIDQQFSKKNIDNPIKKIDDSFIDYGYKELGTYKDESFRAGKTDSLLSAINVFDNDKGFDYVVSPKVKEGKKTFNNVKGVAHFLMDSDITPNQKYTEPYTEKGNNIVKSSQIGKFVPYVGKNPNDYVMYYRDLGNNKMNIKYGQLKDQFKFLGYEQIKVRNVPFGELDFNKKTDAGFAKNASYIGTIDDKQTSIITDPESNDVYGRFSGGSGVFHFKEPKTGKTISVDVSGSVNTIKQVGEELCKKYNVDPMQLQFLYHDMGSYSAKPKSKNGVLSNEQWENYNTNNKGYSGAALMFPKEFGGKVTADTIYTLKKKPKVVLTPDDIYKNGGIVQAWIQKFQDGGMAKTATGGASSGMMGSMMGGAGGGGMGGMMGGGNPVSMIVQGVSQAIGGIFSTLGSQKKATEQQGQQSLQNAYQQQQINDLKAAELNQEQLQPYKNGEYVFPWIQKAQGGITAEELYFPTNLYPNWATLPNQNENIYSRYNTNPKIMGNKAQMALPENNSALSSQILNKDGKMPMNKDGKIVGNDVKTDETMSKIENMSNVGQAIDLIGSSVGDFSNIKGDVRNKTWQDAKAAAAKSNPIFGAFHGIDEGLQGIGKMIGGDKGQKGVQFFTDPIGFWMNLGSGIKTREEEKRKKQLKYDERNMMPIVNQPSYYGQYMAKYGANPKMMEQRVIDDIYSDFDKYLKLT